MTATPLLEVNDLRVGFPARGGMRPSREQNVVAGIGYTLAPGRTLGVVGESGCGKSMTALALMGLVPAARPGQRLCPLRRPRAAAGSPPPTGARSAASASPWCSRSR